MIFEDITFTSPSIEYAPLAPMLVVFGAALLGVLVEAFVPRAHRRTTQLWLTLGALVIAFLLVVRFALNSSPTLAAEGAVAIDGPALFLQGTILVLAFAAVFTLAERSR